jgi:hypothetical protein
VGGVGWVVWGGVGGVGSYPLLIQAPTPVEVELGCDNLIFRVSFTPTLHTKKIKMFEALSPFSIDTSKVLRYFVYRWQSRHMNAQIRMFKDLMVGSLV